MKKIFLLSILAFAVSCKKEQSEITKNTKNTNVEEITSISELNSYGKNLKPSEDKYNYYFQLYKLQEAEKLKSNPRLSNLSINELLKIVTISYDFQAQEFDKSKFKKVSELDSIYKINKNEFQEKLKNEYYYGFDVSLVDYKKNDDNSFDLDKNDERKTNPKIITLLNFQPTSSGGSPEHNFIIENNKVRELKIIPNEKDCDIITKKINNILKDEINPADIYIYGADKIIKLENNIYDIYLNVSNEGEGGTAGSRNHLGYIKYKSENFDKIIINSAEFYNNQTKKWTRL